MEQILGVASDGGAELPKEPELLIRQIYTYVSGSAKRCAQLSEMQSYFNMKHHKIIIRLSGTRSLSLHQCVLRILENSEEAYFRISCLEDQLESAEKILFLLENKTVKSYFYFLKYLLNFMNSFNPLFV
jgi:hypothetical protein